MNSDVWKEHQVDYGSRKIDFHLTYRDRKTMEITVHPDLSVRVVSPEGKGLDEIKKRVVKRASWILKQQRDFGRLLPHTPPRKYVGGETHRYRGRQYRLKIVKSDREEVKLQGPFLWIYTADRNDRDQVKALLEDWYRSHARRVFPEKMDWAIKTLKKHRITFDEPPPIEIRKMRRRWGSCTAKGKILLNLALIQAPTYGLEYVVIHELCHLVHPHHGAKFYRLLERVLPDWKERKERMEMVMS